MDADLRTLEVWRSSLRVLQLQLQGYGIISPKTAALVHNSNISRLLCVLDKTVPHQLFYNKLYTYLHTCLAISTLFINIKVDTFEMITVTFLS